jgi:NFACT protein RNA binding domain
MKTSGRLISLDAVAEANSAGGYTCRPPPLIVKLIMNLKFHVDNLSSAHVYLRLKSGDDWTSITQALLEDCAQLTKANSIDGK